MKECLVIRNFGPIREAELRDIRPFTILIGESGSGKSTILKVLALFRWIFKMYNMRSYLWYSGVNRSPFRFRIQTLLKSNGLEKYLRDDTEIIYGHGSCVLTYNKKDGLKGAQNKLPKDELTLEKMAFISDKRNLIPDIVNNNAQIRKDLFYLNETYEDYQKATKHINQLDIKTLGIRLVLKKTNMGVKHVIRPIDGDVEYEINLNESSSGTQNLIPLNAIVEYYAQFYDMVASMNKAVLRYVSESDMLEKFSALKNIGDIKHKRVDIFVEEPELSLYPSSQCDLIDLMVNRCFNQRHPYDMSLMMATHSPYIVSYMNVLFRRSAASHEAYIDGKNVAVYRVCNGGLQNLMAQDDVTGEWMVDTTDLTEVMDDIFNEYMSLSR